MKSLMKFGGKGKNGKSDVPQPSPTKKKGDKGAPKVPSAPIQKAPAAAPAPSSTASPEAKPVHQVWNDGLPRFEDLSSFKDVSADEKPALFLKKLSACRRMYVWEDGVEPEDDPDWPQKELKRKQLIELVDYINQNPKNVFHEGNLKDVVDFVSTNMFRGFLANPTPPHIMYDPEEDEPLLEPCWPHLQFVMEFFLRFIVSSDVDPKVAKKHIDQGFITKLLALFDSEDVRERDFLKTILHRIYGKFMPHRSFIRKSINNVFYHFVYNTERHNGVAELLEILGSIINGFALPLKEEHKTFLRRALIPLHKFKYVAMYHNQLSYCITQFCEKDYTLCAEVVEGIMKYWPVTYSPKEVLYLQELEEVLELTQPQEFQAILVPLFRRINRCVMSLHFQVAERALFYWHNEYIVSYIAQHRKQILPIVFPSLMNNTKGHWNPTVYQLTVNVVKMFNEMDSVLFEECAQEYKRTVEEHNASRSRVDSSWETLEKSAVTKAPSGWRPPLIKRVSVWERSDFDIDPSSLEAGQVPATLGELAENDQLHKSKYRGLK